MRRICLLLFAAVTALPLCFGSTSSLAEPAKKEQKASKPAEKPAAKTAAKPDVKSSKQEASPKGKDAKPSKDAAAKAPSKPGAKDTSKSSGSKDVSKATAKGADTGKVREIQQVRKVQEGIQEAHQASRPWCSPMPRPSARRTRPLRKTDAGKPAQGRWRHRFCSRA